MRSNTVKTYIKQLVKNFGTKQKVAQELGVTLRYIYMLEKGEKIPSETLRKLIKILVKIPATNNFKITGEMIDELILRLPTNDREVATEVVTLTLAWLMRRGFLLHKEMPHESTTRRI